MKRQEGLPPHFKARTIRDIYFYLENAYGRLDIGGLATQVMPIEAVIQGLMHKALREYLAFSFKSFVSLPDDFFTVRNQMYQIRCGQRVDQPILEVWILPKEYAADDFLEAEIPLAGGGYFTKIFVAANATLTTHFNRICQLIQLTYGVAYQWLVEVLLKKVSEIDVEGSVSLYNYVRVIFKAESRAFLANKIWLAIFTEEKGYYLLDVDASKHILELLERREYRSTKSPIYHLLHLMGITMPYEKSISRHAIQANKPIDFPLRKVAYISDEADLLKTEEQMVQGNMYSLYAISRTNKMRLIAGYPTRYKSNILPLLEKHRDEIAKIYENQLKKLEKYIGLLRKNFANTNWSQLGDFVGGFTAGLAKSLFQ